MDSEVFDEKKSSLFRKLIHDCPGHERQYFVGRFWLHSRDARASILRTSTVASTDFRMKLNFSKFVNAYFLGQVSLQRNFVNMTFMGLIFTIRYYISLPF